MLAVAGVGAQELAGVSPCRPIWQSLGGLGLLGVVLMLCGLCCSV